MTLVDLQKNENEIVYTEEPTNDSPINFVLPSFNPMTNPVVRNSFPDKGKVTFKTTTSMPLTPMKKFTDRVEGNVKEKKHGHDSLSLKKTTNPISSKMKSKIMQWANEI